MHEQFKKLTLAELLVDPCKICKSRALNDRPCKPADDFYGCGFYWEILCTQWDETCSMIRERAGKKK